MAPNKRILLCLNSEEAARFFREQLIAEGSYTCDHAADADTGLSLFKTDPYDLVIIGADHGPGRADWQRLLLDLRTFDPDCVIIIFSEELNAELIEKTAGLGVYDYLSRPLQSDRLFFVARKAIERRGILVAHRRHLSILKEQNLSLQKQNVLLARRIEESAKNLSRLYEDLRSVYMRTIRVLAQAIDARDHYTHSHSMNVARIAVAIAQEIGLTVKETELVREAAELHDLGKIGVEDNILVKPASLTPEEWQQVRLHPDLGAQILEPLTFMADVVELIRQHHEHFDGSGYPKGRKQEEILLGARIIHLADAFEAMTTARSYRKIPLTKQQAIQEISLHTNTQFDPKVVEAFMKIAEEL